MKPMLVETIDRGNEIEFSIEFLNRAGDPLAPLYSAVMLWDPTDRPGEHDAVLPLRAVVHSVVAPSRNVTVPTELGLDDPVTVALKVRGSP